MKKRVLLIIRDASGGMLNHLKDLVEGLDLEAFQVEVAGPVQVLCSCNFGCPQHLIPITDGIHPLNEVRLLIRLASLIRGGEYDLIHFHGYKAAFLGYIATRICGKHNLVATAHNLWPFTGKAPFQRLLGALSGYSLRRCDRLIAVSEAVRKDLINYARVAQDRVITIYNGIRFNQLEAYSAPVDELFSGPDLLIVGTVARLIPAKGISDLLKAAQIVSIENPQVRFLIVGDGPFFQDFLEERDALGLTDKVIFAGHRKDVPYILSLIHLFVLPSHSEGLPLTVLEAMASGKAVLATEVGGIPEVITHGKTGFLVPPHEPKELAKGIIGLLSDNELLIKLGEAGRYRVMNSFSVGRMIEETEKLYNFVLK